MYFLIDAWLWEANEDTAPIVVITDIGLQWQYHALGCSIIVWLLAASISQQKSIHHDKGLVAAAQIAMQLCKSNSYEIS